MQGYWALHLLAVNCGQMLAAARVGAIADVMLQHQPRGSVQLRMRPLWRSALAVTHVVPVLLSELSCSLACHSDGKGWVAQCFGWDDAAGSC